jgi:hypothetical protein
MAVLTTTREKRGEAIARLEGQASSKLIFLTPSMFRQPRFTSHPWIQSLALRPTLKNKLMRFETNQHTTRLRTSNKEITYAASLAVSSEHGQLEFVHLVEPGRFHPFRFGC